MVVAEERSRSMHIDKRKWMLRKEVGGGPDGSGIDLLCSDRVRILGFVIRVI